MRSCLIRLSVFFGAIVLALIALMVTLKRHPLGPPDWCARSEARLKANGFDFSLRNRVQNNMVLTRDEVSRLLETGDPATS